MSNFELDMLKSGKKTTFNNHVVYQKDSQFSPCYKLPTGEINFQRMQKGLAPIGSDGYPINLHHMKQQKNGLLVEITHSDHKKNHAPLHRYTKESEVDREAFNALRQLYWKQRIAVLPQVSCNL